jgi:hypothetical protein
MTHLELSCRGGQSVRRSGRLGGASSTSGGIPTGGGTGYVGTIDGVEVFTTDVEDGHSYLFSAIMLDVIAYRLVTSGAFVSVAFEEGDNPWSGTVVVRFAQQVAWRDTPVLDLVTQSLPSEEEMPTAP